MTPAPCVALLTDFGEEDSYAGILRGVLLNLAPASRLIDLTHGIPPGDIRRGAVTLWESQPFFPKGTIFLSVVDPGVGTTRRGMALVSPDWLFVGPDNGLVSFLMAGGVEWQAREISNPDLAAWPVSGTFHGRDIFAPAAARMVLGDPIETLGPPILEPVRLSPPLFRGDDNLGWEGEVLHGDRFGNAISSIGRIRTRDHQLEPWLIDSAQAGRIGPNAQAVLSDGRRLPLRKTYGDSAPGELAAIIGSNGLLEISANGTRALDDPALHPGAHIRLIPER